MAKTETAAPKRAELLNSMGDETFAISRFYTTLATWRKLVDEPAQSAAVKAQAFDKMVKLSLMMRDYPLLSKLMAEKSAASLPAETRKAAAHAVDGALDSALDLPPSLYRLALQSASGDDEWVNLFKAQYKMPAELRAEVASKVSAKCQGANNGLCKWASVSHFLDDANRFGASIPTTPAALNGVEAVAAKMNGLLEQMRLYQGSGDPQLDILLSLAESKIYASFAAFLGRVGKANPQVAPILAAKANESLESAKKSRAQCQTIITSAKLVSPTNKACQTGQLPTLEAALKWPGGVRPSYESADPKSPDVVDMEKNIFVDRKDWKKYFDLAELYLSKGQLQHASGLSVYASSVFKDDQEQFNAIIGCVASKMGLNGEAKFYLDKASDLNGHKQECAPK